jgi:arginase family enzyme
MTLSAFIMPTDTIASLIVFLARTADRNPRGMAGAELLGRALSTRLKLPPEILGEPQPPLRGGWQEELETARPALQRLAQASDNAFRHHRKPIMTMGRCAAALATLPIFAKHRPDALLVWFDAHADTNTPSTSPTGYLGGMVIAAAAGLWDSGLGTGLSLSHVVLVGVRDVDPAEQALIDAHRLREAIGHRPIYIHIDCDVLAPGIAPTEYRVPGGLTLADLHACCDVLACNEIVGLEIAEFEDHFPEHGAPASPGGLLDAASPLLNNMSATPTS